ncbi:hypothetical protein KR084_003659 [Drosophila pseudotakahashii]|nr:hypothetical protein KR084_003659 [Drosophila pseudotakahashii]
MDLEILLLAVLTLISHANGEKYELLVVDEDIFTSCRDPDPGTLDIHGFFDISNFSTSMDADGVTVSGNLTSIWDIQLKDRVQVTVNLLYFERGTWTSTVFSMNSRDFCKDMYDQNKFWYKYWTQYVLNDIQDKCVNVPGVSILINLYEISVVSLAFKIVHQFIALQTKMIHRTFLLSLITNAVGLREGRYKANIMFRAYDSSGTERPTRICIEIQGDVFKVLSKN